MFNWLRRKKTQRQPAKPLKTPEKISATSPMSETLRLINYVHAKNMPKTEREKAMKQLATISKFANEAIEKDKRKKEKIKKEI